jgi:hypothetical protein
MSGQPVPERREYRMRRINVLGHSRPARNRSAGGFAVGLAGASLALGLTRAWKLNPAAPSVQSR